METVFPLANDMQPASSIAAEVRAEMTTQHARITALAPVLQGELDPAPVTATAPSPLEVGWRVREGERS